ncbi:hypothetical protein V8E53_004379 [Lactarius tabidus]
MQHKKLTRHQYDKVIKDKNKGKTGDGPVLRLEELTYDEAFTLTCHLNTKRYDVSIELHVLGNRQFANLHTPSGPSSQVVRLIVLQSCCAEAARVLVRALGGENEVRRAVGGVRWRQVRPGDGELDAEWVMDKRDWKEAKCREKAAAAGEKMPTPGESASPQSPSTSPSGAHAQASTGGPEANAYPPEMDELQCFVGTRRSGPGGYYFGSVDQERYSTIAMRFACSSHGPENAGIWSSVTEVCYSPEVPTFTLIPPSSVPCKTFWRHTSSSSSRLRKPLTAPLNPATLSRPRFWSASTRGRHARFSLVRFASLSQASSSIPIRQRTRHEPYDIQTEPALAAPPDDVNQQVHKLLCNPAGNRPSAVVVPIDNDNCNRVAEMPVIRPEDRETMIQLYTTNDLLIHPLVSPGLADLGGLPPLFFIASDREVLRDEIVYTAHRAANPEKYPLSDAVKKLYSAYEGIESRMKPTMVHLQVYDDHVIPMTFIATNPAKYCYRAIATFIKHLTNMPPTTALQKHKPRLLLQTSDLTPGETVLSPAALSPVAEDGPPTSAPPSAPTKPTRFSRMTTSVGHEDEYTDLLAGDPIIYHGRWAKEEFPGHDSYPTMIRERITTHGVVRPLEPEPELPALHIDCGSWPHLSTLGTGLPRKSGGGKVEGEGWSVAWALDDADERPPPSGLVARCDTAEALALAQAAAATKRKRNARLAAVTSVSGTRKRRMQDGEEKGKNAARSRPASELWRRLSCGHSTAAAPAITSTAGLQPQVVVAA